MKEPKNRGIVIVSDETVSDADIQCDPGLSNALKSAYGDPQNARDTGFDLDKICEEAKRRRDISRKRRTYFFYASAACAAFMAVFGIGKSIAERSDFMSVVEESLSFEYEHAEEGVERELDTHSGEFVSFLYEETEFAGGDFQNATEEYVSDLLGNKGVFSP